MDYSVYSINSVSDAQIAGLIASRTSFVLEDIARLNMPEAVASVEKAIESRGLKCRVYTKGRAAALAGELAVPLVGWAAAAAMGIHRNAGNLANSESAEAGNPGNVRHHCGSSARRRVMEENS